MDILIPQLVLIAHDIYNSLGSGYNEVIYHRAFEVALRISGIQYESEVITPVFYKGACVGHGRVDLKLNNLIIELKAINVLNNDALIQIKNYMIQHSINNGLIVNFGQNTKSSGKNLGIILVKDQIIYYYTNETFIQSSSELNF